MSQTYKAVGWNRQKKRYDCFLLGWVGLFLVVFCGVAFSLHPEATAETVLIRALASCAFVLLHVILCIGPLARLDSRFLPLLYNRRHLGVTMFVVALLHGAFSLFQFHALGNVNPLVSLLAGNTSFGSIAQFPFEWFGVLALIQLFLMAATSHDFWLAQFTAPVWKALHMGVYAAYALVVAHVAMGVLQAETSWVYTALIFAGPVLVVGLHLVSAFREKALDRDLAAEGFVDVCAVNDIPEKRAKVVCLGGERIAIFKYDGKLSALSAVCQHQNGPLGEGCVVGGLVTCPWHGYQYRPEDGASPAPFTEKVPTFQLKRIGTRVHVNPVPNKAGTRVEPERTQDLSDGQEGLPAFYVGYQKVMPPKLAQFLRPRVLALFVFGTSVATLLACVQKPFGSGRFAYGHPESFEGIVLPGSSPTLLLASPQGTNSRYLLCAPGKHGAGPLFSSPVPQRVRLSGTLVERDGKRMIEVIPESIREEASAVDGPSVSEELGEMTLFGEIVDSKCYLGVMKPGNLKPHKACAIRCIRGGIPPVFLVRDAEGNAFYFLIEGADGRAINREVSEFVAEPLEISGRVERRDDMLVLKAEPTSYRRL